MLTADGNKFDRNWNDYDIVTEAVLAVLAAKPSSAVGVLADGKVALTAFLPTDRAFRNLVGDLTGKWYRSESKVFDALVAAVGVDTVEAVLLYHVVPGATVTRKDALKADGAVLQTALAGASVTVDVKCRWFVIARRQRPRRPQPVGAEVRHQPGQPADRAWHHGGAASCQPVRSGRSGAVATCDGPRGVVCSDRSG